MRLTLLSTLVIPLWLLASPALADDAVAQAKQRFTAGTQAFREARYKDAVELFLQANALDPHAELLYNIGLAYEDLDDVTDALRWYREYLRLLPGVSSRATVEGKIKRLEAALVARGVQQLTVLSTPVAATLLIDDKIVGQTPWTGEIAPGQHRAVLKLEGYAAAVKELVLLPDHAMDVEVTLSHPAAEPIAPAAAPPGAPEAPVSPPPDAGTKPGPRVAPWTIATLGAGVAALAAALGFEVARQSAESAARNDPTQVGYQSAYDTMISRQTAARAFAGAGAAVTVAGGVLLVLDLRGGAGAPQQKAGLGCFAGACGAFASGRF